MRCTAPVCRWCWWSTRSIRVTDKTKLLPYLAKVTKAAILPACIRSRRSSARAWRRWSRPCCSRCRNRPRCTREDEITDKSQRFLAGELVREQLMRQLGEELPYATTVEIEKFEE